MRTWSKHPVIYEINTLVWLCELSRKYQRSLNLATVPQQEWDAIDAKKLAKDAEQWTSAKPST